MKEGIRRDQYRVIAISSSIVSETLCMDFMKDRVHWTGFFPNKSIELLLGIYFMIIGRETL